MTTSTAHPAWHKAISLMILAGLCAYADSFTGVYVLDDNWWIPNNPDLPYFGRFIAAWFPGRWFVALTIELNYQVGGLDTRGYHFVNLAIHIAAGLVLFDIVRRTLLLPRWLGRFDSSAPGLALAVALIWLVHPLNTQSVTYIIQRCESLMGLFYLLTLYCVLRTHNSSRAGLWQVAAVGCLVLGLGCKEVAATAPIVVLLFDWVFMTQSFRATFKHRWPVHAALAVLMVGYLSYVAYGLATAAPGDVIGFTVIGMTPATYLMTQAGVILHYLQLSFWPVGFCLDYSGWPIATSISDVLLPGLGVTALLIATFFLLARRSAFGFLGVWFFFILAPTSSIVPINDVVFEHRMYLPLAALVVLAVIACNAIIDMLRRQFAAVENRVRLAKGIVLLAVACTLAALTFQRNAVYRHAYFVWQDVIEKRPDNTRACVTIQPHLAFAGRGADGVPLLEAALALDPHNYHVLSALIDAHLQRGEFEAAQKNLSVLEKLLPFLPGKSQVEFTTRWNLHQAMLYVGEQEPQKALLYFRRAAELRPEFPYYRYDLAGVLAELGFAAEAETEYARAAATAPNLAVVFAQQARSILLGKTHVPAYQKRNALLSARIACASQQDLTPSRLDVLAMALAANGRFDEAAAVARRGAAMASAQGDMVWATALQDRAKGYAAGRPLTKPS